MTKNTQTGRKTRNIVRMPATKLAHLKKRMQKAKVSFHAKTRKK